MLKVNPSDRITAVEAYAHPWIINNLNVEPLSDQVIEKIGLFIGKSKAIRSI